VIPFAGSFAGCQDREGVPFRAGLHAGQKNHILLYGNRYPETGDHLAEGRDRAVSSQVLPGRLIHLRGGLVFSKKEFTIKERKINFSDNRENQGIV